MTARIIALDAVVEAASILSMEAAALIAAAACSDIAETEARLWMCRQCLTAAIKSWREAVPALDQEKRMNDD